MAEATFGDRGTYKRQIDRIVLGLSVVLSVSLVGIYLEVASLVFFPMPFVLCLLLLLPCVRNDGRHTGASVVVALFAAVMLALYTVIWIAETSGSEIAGKPAGGALFVYVLWPYTVVVGGLVYAYCYRHWLRRSDLGPEAAEAGIQGA